MIVSFAYWLLAVIFSMLGAFLCCLVGVEAEKAEKPQSFFSVFVLLALTFLFVGLLFAFLAGVH